MVQNAAAACVSPLVLATTIKTATLLAAGKTLAAGAVSAKVAALTQGVLKAMLLSKLKIVTMVVLTAGIIVGGAGTTGLVYHRQTSASAAAIQPPAPQAKNKQDILKKSKKDADWKDVEAVIMRFGIEELKKTHRKLIGADVSEIRDCRKCHSANANTDLFPPAQVEIEGLREKLSSLQRELQQEATSGSFCNWRCGFC